MFYELWLLDVRDYPLASKKPILRWMVAHDSRDALQSLAEERPFRQLVFSRQPLSMEEAHQLLRAQQTILQEHQEPEPQQQQQQKQQQEPLLRNQNHKKARVLPNQKSILSFLEKYLS